MTRPVTTDQPATQLAFYIQRERDDERLYLDTRVKVLRVVDAADGNSDADVEIDWQATPRHGDLPVRHELTQAELSKRYDHRLRCAIIQIGAGVTDLRDMPVLIHGYIDVDGLDINGSPDPSGSFIRRTLKIRSILSRAGRRVASTIQGRYMLSAAAHDEIFDPVVPPVGPPATTPIDMPWGDLAKLVQSCPAIFNFQGKPNRLARPVLFRSDDAWDETAPFHLFTYDGDPDAEYWTLLQALRYIIMVYLPFGDDENLGPGELFTSPKLSGTDVFPLWEQPEWPSPQYTSLSPGGWTNMMLRNANNLSIEGFSLTEALIALGKQSGTHFNEVHTNEAQNGKLRVLSNLNFWAPGDTIPSVMFLERNVSSYQANGQLRSTANILASNDVQSCNMRLDTGASVERSLVIGGRRWVVETIELWPFWKPDPRWDDVDAGDADDYRSDAYSDPFVVEKESEFYKRYCPHGQSFDTEENRSVGRLWGANWSGELPQDEFARTTGPYQNYLIRKSLTSPSGVLKSQVRRRRIVDHLGRKNGVAQDELKAVLEMSLDAGDTWQKIEAEFVLLRTIGAIYFKQSNLLSIGQEVVEDLGSVDNYYDAYLKHALRFRITWSVEADERLTATSDGNAIPQYFSLLFDKNDIVKMVLKKKSFHSREEGDHQLPHGLDFPGELVDDSDSAELYAAAVYADTLMGRWRGNPVVPWIESDRYKVGEPIAGIYSPSNHYFTIFGGNLQRTGWWPHVVAKAFNAETQTTEITLRDYRLRLNLKGQG